MHSVSRKPNAVQVVGSRRNGDACGSSELQHGDGPVQRFEERKKCLLGISFARVAELIVEHARQPIMGLIEPKNQGSKRHLY